MKILVIIHTVITLVAAALGTIALIAAFMGQTHCFLTAAMLGGLTWAGMCSIDEITKYVAGKQNASIVKRV